MELCERRVSCACVQLQSVALFQLYLCSIGIRIALESMFAVAALEFVSLDDDDDDCMSKHEWTDVRWWQIVVDNNNDNNNDGKTINTMVGYAN